MLGAAELKTIRLMALKDVLQPDTEGLLRRIFRSYSKTFHTPLHLVEDLPLQDVLLAFFTEQYEGIENPHDLERERMILTETPEEHRNREMLEESMMAEDMEFLKAAEQEAQMAEEDTKARHDRLIAKVQERDPLGTPSKAPKSPPMQKAVPTLDALSQAFKTLSEGFQNIPDIAEIPDEDLAALPDSMLQYDHAPKKA